MSRVYGRIETANGLQWVEVDSDNGANNDAINITWLAQVLQLNLGESPFWTTWGIPQYKTIMTQVFPTYYVMLIQKQFSDYFSSLVISQLQYPAPVYRINLTTNKGQNVITEIPI